MAKFVIIAWLKRFQSHSVVICQQMPGKRRQKLAFICWCLEVSVASMTFLLEMNRENKLIQKCNLNLRRNLLILVEKKERLS